MNTMSMPETNRRKSLDAIRVYAPSHLEIRFGGQEKTGEYLVCSIANGKIIGGGIPICPAADVHDGLLDLVMIRNVPRWKIPFYLPGLMMSKDLSFKITEHVRTKEVTISGQGLKFNIDGDIKRMDEARFVIQPGSCGRSIRGTLSEFCLKVLQLLRN